MSNRRFKELLRRMPSIAKSVNAFASESIQELAYNDLMKAFSDSNTDSDGSAKPSAEAKQTESKTADILAMARQEKEKTSTTAAKPKSSADEKVSDVEVFKRESQYLRGDIAAETNDGNDHYSKGSVQLLKHYGTYQEVNRDQRVADRAAGIKEDKHIFMVRTKVPGGRLTSKQLLAEIDLGDELGDTTLRVTSRQGLQLHGVLKSNLKQTIRRINEVQASTLGACGDVNRNVMCCPAPYSQPIYREIQALADGLADHFAPRTTAYHELWLQDSESGERQLVGGGSNGEEVEPIYGKHYLPRKFKMAVAFPHDNCIDIYTHDLGMLAIVRDEKIVGYNVLVGGGQGVTPSAKKTFPALAKRLGFVPPEQAISVAEAVVKVQRDFGNRSDRKVARLKYLIHNWGIEKFKAKVEEYLGQPIAEPDPADVHGFNDHMGWDEQDDGKLFYGLNIENGRIRDTDQMQLKAALREICHTIEPGIRLTSHQSILFTDVAAESKEDLEGILRKHNVPLSEEVSTVRRWSMACVAWPTCALSITESERALPGVMDELEVELAKLGLSREAFTVRMTGCPNGCARPYNSDIGLVGKAKGKYTVFVGGRLLGNRLNFIHKDMVPAAEVVPTLVPLFAYFKQDREDGETFGDFCNRVGNESLLSWAEQYAPTAH